MNILVDYIGQDGLAKKSDFIKKIKSYSYA